MATISFRTLDGLSHKAEVSIGGGEPPLVLTRPLRLPHRRQPGYAEAQGFDDVEHACHGF